MPTRLGLGLAVGRSWYLTGTVRFDRREVLELEVGQTDQ